MKATEQIRRALTKLTPAQHHIAQFLMENGDAAAFMTARQMASAVGQSDAAVVRFAKAVGYGGFSKFRDALRGELLDIAGSSGMQAQAIDDPSDRMHQHVASISDELIRKTIEINSTNAFEAVVSSFIEAARISVTGHGTSYPLAVYLSMHLNQCLDKARIFTVDHGDLAERFRSVGETDVFVGIGYIRYLPYTIEILRQAKKSGARVVAITDKLSSPLAEHADHVLLSARSSGPVWWSQAGTFAIADTLIAMSIQAEKHTAHHLRSSDEMLKRLGYWRATGSSTGGRSSS